MSAATIDVGNLMIYDQKLTDTGEYKKDLNAYLQKICQESTQLLFNELFKLPTETVEDVIVANLPKPSTLLPREKPLPKAKAPTKWQQYALLKGIRNKKKSRMVYDEAGGEWKPRWGYKRANDNTKDWLIEIPKNEDPNQDFFAKRIEAKNERKHKNELQRLRNISRSKNGKVRGIGLIPTDNSTNKLELTAKLNYARRSDASMSKFSEKVEGEERKTKGFAKKRKYESNHGSLNDEKEKHLKMFSKLVSNKDKSTKEKLDIEKAVNKHMSNNEDQEGKNRKKFSNKKTGGRDRRTFKNGRKRTK